MAPSTLLFSRWNLNVDFYEDWGHHAKCGCCIQFWSFLPSCVSPQSTLWSWVHVFPSMSSFSLLQWNPPLLQTTTILSCNCVQSDLYKATTFSVWPAKIAGPMATIIERFLFPILGLSDLNILSAHTVLVVYRFLKVNLGVKLQWLTKFVLLRFNCSCLVSFVWQVLKQ